VLEAKQWGTWQGEDAHSASGQHVTHCEKFLDLDSDNRRSHALKFIDGDSSNVSPAGGQGSNFPMPKSASSIFERAIYQFVGQTGQT